MLFRFNEIIQTECYPHTLHPPPSLPPSLLPSFHPHSGNETISIPSNTKESLRKSSQYLNASAKPEAFHYFLFIFPGLPVSLPPSPPHLPPPSFSSPSPSTDRRATPSSGQRYKHVRFRKFFDSGNSLPPTQLSTMKLRLNDAVTSRLICISGPLHGRWLQLISKIKKSHFHNAICKK